MKIRFTAISTCIFFSFVCTFSSIHAQPVDESPSIDINASIIKYNLTPTALGHYSIQYELITSPAQSFAIGFGVSPNVPLPFKSTLLDLFGEKEDARVAIESTTFTSINVTPEYRFYVGPNGAPEGFYFATFIRYTHMSHSQIYQFTPSSGKLHTPEITTEFNGVGVGEMIGVQWLLGEKEMFTLDWWIVGPFFGFMNGTSHGTDDMSDMSAEDKADLENDIESVPIPLWTIDATVGEGVVDADLKGGFYGARLMGLCIGFRF